MEQEAAQTSEAPSDTSTMTSDAFVVLERAVSHERSVHGRWPTASRVRIVMKELTYDGFAPARLGFKRFRDFLQAAEAAGAIALDSSNAGDILVALPGETEPAARATRHARIRKDLWSALLDWTRGVDYYFDLDIDRPVVLP
ncbi:MAG: hypothetical protein ACRDPS_03780, partial [Nocardioides sp.]|uniref:hypothetical protein n=1 Tax=Nocardioides sp. TaxID=35761 RepID=UPI003D6AF739